MIALVLLIALSAHEADDPKIEQARKYFEAGKQAYEAGLFLGAASAFEEAYQLSPRPQIAFSLAQAYRRQYFIDKDPAHVKQAVDYLKKYVGQVQQGGRRADALQFLQELEPIAKKADEELRRGVSSGSRPKAEPTQLMVSSRTKDAVASIDGGALSELPVIRDVSPGKHKVHLEANGFFPEDVEELAVENRLVVVELSLREKPARIVLAAPAGADVAVNGRPVGTTPLAHPIEVPAGPSFLTVTERGSYPFSRELDLGRDQEIKVDAPLETTTQRKIAWWFGGGGAALLLAGGTTAAFAYVQQKKARDQDASITKKLEMGMNASTDDIKAYNDDVSRRDRLVTASTVLLTGGFALGAVGALLFWVDNPRVEEPSLIREKPQPSSPELSMWLGGGVIGGTFARRF